MSKEQKLKRFFENAKPVDDWEKDYARMIAFVEREGGVTVTVDYPHFKLLNQYKYFNEFKMDDWKLLGKMLGCVK